MYNNKKIGLIIPARYNSERLPGKILMNIAGKKQIEWIIERALQSKYIDCIILAISDKEYEEILDWYNKDEFFNFYGTAEKKVFKFIGEHDNIIKRCLDSAKEYEIDIIVDTSHDCTFFDPYLSDVLIERLFEYNVDYSANCITRTFPNGFDIQVYTKKIYQKAYNTNHKYNYYSGWNIWHCREEIKAKIINLETSKEYYYPHWHLCLDTEEDKIVIEKIINAIGGFNDYKFIINYLQLHPEILEINKNVKDTLLLEELK
jgi:spore coat polysaccharide biosynthesis protein SpsF